MKIFAQDFRKSHEHAKIPVDLAQNIPLRKATVII